MLYFNSARFTHFGMNVSTYDKLLSRVDLYIIPSTLRSIHMHITNYVKINLTTCKLMSGDISIDWMQIASGYNTRYVSINVAVSDYRWFKLRSDAVLNIYPSTHSYNNPYLLEYIENFQNKYIQLPCCISIQLDSLTRR